MVQSAVSVALFEEEVLMNFFFSLFLLTLADTWTYNGSICEYAFARLGRKHFTLREVTERYA